MSDRAVQKEFSNQIKKLSGSEGVDVVYDAVGGDYAEPAVRALAWKGRYLVVGFPAGIPKIPLNLTLLKGCQIVGVFWGAHTLREPAMHTENLGDLFRLYSEGKVKPRISASYPLAQASDALKLLSDRKVLGKVVVTMD
jgi:NADPH2:quinone reductase